MRGIFGNLQAFDQLHVLLAPNEAGVYILWKVSGPKPEPFYVGRSRVSMRGRLLQHWLGTGSRKIAATRKNELAFECQAMISVEQVEAILIKELPTYPVGNLRRETDPADRW
jgi:hypothetical protein